MTHMRGTSIYQSRRTKVALFAASLMVSSGVSAQSPESIAPDSVSGQQGDIIVTANKRTQSTLDVAGSVTAIGSAQLDQLGALKLSDYAAFIPGLQVQAATNTGFQTIILRGIAPLQESATTATYIDDVPVGSVSNESEGGLLPIDVDPSELQRVEVLNGPQGTLYGSSSLGGVVKYVTKLPDLHTFSGHFSADGFAVEHGDAGTEIRAGISIPLIDDKLALSLSGHFRSDPGYINDVGVGGKNANSGQTKGLRGSLYFAPGGGWDVKLGVLIDRVSSDSTNTVSIDELTRQPVYGKYDQRHYALSSLYSNLDLYSATIDKRFDNDITATSATSGGNLTLGARA
jgi:outer membrane receptor for ferrienterochelin and colicin